MNGFGQRFDMTKMLTIKNSLKWFSMLFPIAIFLADGFYKPYIKSQTSIMLVDVATFFIIPAGCLIFLKSFFELSPSDYGLRLKPSEDHFVVKRSLFFDIIISIFLLGIVWELSSAFAWRLLGSSSQTETHGIYSILEKSDKRFLLALYMSLTAAFAEEIFFRGVVYNFFVQLTRTKIVNNLFFVIVSTLLFGISHWERGDYLMASSFVYGFAAALLYLEYKYLTPLIIAHFIIDLYEFSK
jgi:membrane protease YdiL (CAAX protease family)